MKRKLGGLSVGLALAAFSSFVGGVPAWAHDAYITGSIDGLGSDYALDNEHEDADPWKGYVNITLTNTGTDPWGDLHLAIYQVTTSVANVDFIVTSPYQPTSSQSGLSWVVDNTPPDGSTLDLYFYGDPVLPTEMATFTVYTDNTVDNVSFFGVTLYPTPVPEPSTALLLASGLIGLAFHGRRRRA